MPIIAWLIFVAAAILEVAGVATIRNGLRGNRAILIAVGFAVLCCYGTVVNLPRWDFSRLLGVYIAVFATVAVLCGRFVFGENVPTSTWVGLAFIVLGGLVIQFGAESK
jgi:drug/metabolite transporter superfamily protein YnfA